MSVQWMLCAGSVAVALIAAEPVQAQSNPQQQKQQRENQQQKEATSQQAQTAQRVALGDLEENPSLYMGRAVTVPGEIDEVLGPRVFKIDEQNWVDLDGEVLVVMAAPMAALVDEDDRVTVTGTLRPFVRAEIEREWGFLGLDPAVEVDLKRKPVLVASRLVSTDDNMTLTIRMVPAGSGSDGKTTSAKGSSTSTATGTSGSTAGKSKRDSEAPITDVNVLAKTIDREMVGRRATLTSVKVDGMDKNGGFWVSSSSGDRLYVLPANKDDVNAKAGQELTIDGYIMRMPRQMEPRLEQDPKTGDEEIYVYATSVK